MSNFDHHIIPRQQNFFLERKKITIHNTDRDIGKFPNASLFELKLPTIQKNVTSIRLIDSFIPSNLYKFTESYQNTKFKLRVIPNISENTDEKQQLDIFNSIITNSFIITIDEGSYTPIELQNELQAKINRNITETLQADPYNLPLTYIYDKFRVKYNSIQNKFYFINLRDDFILQFNLNNDYNIPCKQKIVFGQYSDWGLPYYLGFEKKSYLVNSNSTNANDLAFYYDSSVYGPSDDNINGFVRFISSENNVDLETKEPIYLELNKYNQIDEFIPYAENTNSAIDNTQGYKYNSSFAKIPVPVNSFQNNYETTSSLTNITIFKQPEKSISSLKLKFRYHDGRLVDFKKQPFSITIELTSLLDESHKNYSVTMAQYYPMH
jgi:hypothetical protein